MRKTIASFNEVIATRTVGIMSTMACVYVFLILAMVPLGFPGAEATVQYLSGAVIQLIALPLIMVGQAIAARSTDARAGEDHQMLMDEVGLLREELTLLREIHASVTGK